jgi:NADH dehydrogenase (ubiquinone) 1 alpha subcomplex subunit 5
MLSSKLVRTPRCVVPKTNVFSTIICGTSRLFSNSTTLFQTAKSAPNSEKTNTLHPRVKETTNIVGIPVQPRWREMLLKLCDDILEAIKAVPENTFYRVVTENNFKHFRQVVQNNTDYEIVEDLINRGQVEELIMMFEDELQLIPMMVEWKPWEVTETDAAVMRDDLQHNDDFILAEDYEPPVMKFLTTTGVYQVEYTQEELEKAEKEKKKKAEAQQPAVDPKK